MAGVVAMRHHGRKTPVGRTRLPTRAKRDARRLSPWPLPRALLPSIGDTEAAIRSSAILQEWLTPTPFRPPSGVVPRKGDNTRGQSLDIL
jgi:hypothetical protein